MQGTKQSATGLCMLIALIGAWGCTDSSVPPTPLEPAGAAFDENHPDEPEQPGDFAPASFMTGGGRIDCSDSDAHPCPPEKNTPESHDFQTWGFNFGDKNGDGAIEGQLQHVDHRDAYRINGSPRNYHSVSWASYTPIDPAPFCDGGGDGAAEATGTIERKNDGTTWEFLVRVIDCGEPGTKAPHDRYGIRVGDGYVVDGLLTGGNIQAHFKGGASGGSASTAEASSGSASGESSGARASTAAGESGPTPSATLGSGNHDEDSAETVNAGGVVTAEAARVVTTGGADSDQVTSESVSTMANVSILDGLITADRVTAIAASAIGDGTAASNADGSQFSSLVVNGTAIDGNVAPNTQIAIPGVGTVTLNQQVPSGDGVGSSGMTVNMIYVVLQDALTGATTGEIVVGSATSGVSSN